MFQFLYCLLILSTGVKTTSEASTSNVTRGSADGRHSKGMKYEHEFEDGKDVKPSCEVMIQFVFCFFL